MHRRTFVLSSLATLILPCPARAQRSAKVPRIGWLSAGSADIDSSLLAGLRQGLKELGYAEGKSFVLDERYTGGRPEKLADGANDLIRMPPDAIVASGDQAALAAKKATTTIPIVVQVSPMPWALPISRPPRRSAWPFPARSFCGPTTFIP